MQFTFDIDLQAIVAKTMAPENIAPVLEAAIAKAFKSAVDEATGYRSDFRTKLESQLKEALPHGLGIDDVAKFQHVLNSAINATVHGANAEAVRVALSGVAKNVMPEVPVSLTLSELLELARACFHKEKHDAFFAEMEVSDYGTTYIYLDSDENPGSSYSKGKNSAGIRLSLNNAGEVYAMKFDGIDMTPAKTPNVIGKFDAVLMCLYTGRTSLVVDIDADDVKAAAEASYED